MKIINTIFKAPINKIVLITGSGKRIGRGLAISFAEKGWDVIIHYNTSEEKAKETENHIKNLGVKAVIVKADIRNYQEIKDAFESGVNEVGMPDVLVNNAGIYPPETRLKDISDNMWDDTININLRGEYYFAKVFSDKAKEGRIINFSVFAENGVSGGNPTKGKNKNAEKIPAILPHSFHAIKPTRIAVKNTKIDAIALGGQTAQGLIICPTKYV